jgi:biotin transport system permease protein/energy-coupling factor transport system permease protein
MYNFNQYIPGNSAFHHLDPRVKIILVIALSIIILKTGYSGLILTTLVIAACSLIAHIPGRNLLRVMRPAAPLFLCLFLLYIFFTPGRPLHLFTITIFPITCQGLYLGLVQVGKFILLIEAAAVLTITTTPSELTQGFERMLRPLKVIGISSHNLAMMLSLALRFVPTLEAEMNNIKDAQLARGANPRKLSGALRSARYMALALSVNIFHRCDDLIDAMEARGYHAGDRTCLRELVLTRRDYVMLGFIIITAIAVIIGPW